MNIIVQGIQHAALVLVNPCRGALIGWNNLALVCVVNHVLGKDDLLESVEVGLNEANVTRPVSMNPAFVWDASLKS